MIVQTQSTKSPQKIQNYLGVDLSNYNVNKLTVNPIYAQYDKEDLHYVIGVIQKGLKPFTAKGIKRIKKKNQKNTNKTTRGVRRPRRRIPIQEQKQKTTDDTKKLNPLSPEEISIKALRTSFRNELQKNHIKQQYSGEAEVESIKFSLKQINQLKRGSDRRTRRMDLQTKKQQIQQNKQGIQKTLEQLGKVSAEKKRKMQVFLRRKENKARRRKELSILTVKYRQQIQAHFGDRIHGFGRCPKISRQQIKEFLGLKQEDVAAIIAAQTNKGSKKLADSLMEIEIV